MPEFLVLQSAWVLCSQATFAEVFYFFKKEVNKYSTFLLCKHEYVCWHNTVYICFIFNLTFLLQFLLHKWVEFLQRLELNLGFPIYFSLCQNMESDENTLRKLSCNQCDMPSYYDKSLLWEERSECQSIFYLNIRRVCIHSINMPKMKSFIGIVGTRINNSLFKGIYKS